MVALHQPEERGVPLWSSDRAEADELLGLMAPPAWHADAACREHPELTWVPRFAGPSREADLASAKAVCARCLVREECLATALADTTLVGVWGGTTPVERRALRSRPGFGPEGGP